MSTKTVAIVLHKVNHECPTHGIQIPCHTIIPDPFYRPLTFGPAACQAKDELHIGIKTAEPIAATFIGTHGDLLVMSPDTFIILTPKTQDQYLLSDALFPTKDTHDLHLAEKGKAYRIRQGCSIIAGVMDGKENGMRNVAIFLDDPHRECIEALHFSLCHFGRVWNAVAPPQQRSIEVSRLGALPVLPITAHPNLRRCITNAQYKAAGTKATPPAQRAMPPQKHNTEATKATASFQAQLIKPKIENPDHPSENSKKRPADTDPQSNVKTQKQ